MRYGIAATGLLAAALMAAGGTGRVTGPTLFLAGEAGAEDFAFSGGGKRFTPGGGGTVVSFSEMKAEIETGRALVHEGIRKVRAGAFTLVDGAIMKLWLCEMEGRVLDGCLQFFGGSG